MKHFSLPKDGGLKAESIAQDILHSFDRIYTEVRPDAYVASKEIAGMIISEIKAFEASGESRPYKLGLSTGSSPISLYEELCARYKAGEVSFRNVEIISIDDYYPIAPDAHQSRNRKIHESS